MKRLLVIVTAAGLGVCVAPTASAGVDPEVRTFSSGDKSELVDTIPITRERGARPKVVMRIDAGKLGPVEAGDRFLAGGEVEVTTCLDGPTGNDICVGKSYPYDPHVAAKVVLARSPGSTRGEVLGDARELECSQHHPNRNHHCVLALPMRPWIAQQDCTGCHVNLVMTAWKSGQARDGHQLVIGAHGSSGPIEQDKGRLSLVRFRNGALPSDTEPRLGNARSRSVPISGESGGTKYTFVRSLKLSDLKAGDEIHVDAMTKTSISSVPYNVLLSSKVYLARGRKALDHVGTSNYAAPDGQLSELNGFNCTHGRSAHRSPCTAPKLGVARITENVGSLHVIVLIAAKAMMNESNQGSWQPGHTAKVKHSDLRVFLHR